MLKSTTAGYGLFTLRLSLFFLMLVWALLKVTTPASYSGSADRSGIYSSFYSFELSSDMVFMIGVIQIAFLLAFLIGASKFVTTGGVMLMNLVTLLVSMPVILGALAGEGSNLFAASIPVFGALLALFLMREQDTFLSVGQSKIGKIPKEDASPAA